MSDLYLKLRIGDHPAFAVPLEDLAMMYTVGAKNAEGHFDLLAPSGDAVGGLILASGEVARLTIERATPRASP